MTLTKLQKRVYDALTLNQDTPITELHSKAYPEDTETARTVRDQQQRIGSIIARINSKIAPQRIAPGRMKQTYRLELTDVRED